MDEDLIGLEREMTGEQLVTCDFCGQLVPRSSLIRIEGRAGMAEQVEALHACGECRRRIAQGELPFEEEIAAGLQEADDA